VFYAVFNNILISYQAGIQHKAFTNTNTPLSAWVKAGNASSKKCLKVKPDTLYFCPHWLQKSPLKLLLQFLQVCVINGFFYLQPENRIFRKLIIAVIIFSGIIFQGNFFFNLTLHFCLLFDIQVINQFHPENSFNSHSFFFFYP